MATSALKVQTAKAMVWKVLERSSCLLASLIVQIVLARILDPSYFGILALLVVFVNIANVLVQVGLPNALVQSRVVEDGDYASVFWVNGMISAALYLILFALAPCIESFYGLANMSLYLRVTCLVLPISAINSVHVARLSRSLAFRKLFRATLTGTVVSGALGIAAALLGLGIWSLVLQQISNQVVICIALLALTRWIPRGKPSFKRAKMLFSYGGKLLVASLVSCIFDNMYDLVVGKFYSSNVLAYFNQGRKYPLQLQSVLNGSLQSVLLSSMSKIQTDASELATFMRQTLQILSFFMAGFMVLGAVLGEPIILLLLSSKWAGAIPFFQLFCLACAFGSLGACNQQAINAIGRSDVTLRLEFVKKSIAFLILILSVLLFDDPIFIAWGAVLYSPIADIINAIPSGKLLGLPLSSQLKSVAPSYLSAVAAGVVGYCVSLHCASLGLKLALPFVAYALVYVALALVLKNKGLTEAVKAIRMLKDMRIA